MRDVNRIVRWDCSPAPCGASAWPRMAGILTSGGSSHYEATPNYFCLHLITRGSGTLRTAECDWPLRKGSIFTHWPERHSEYFEDSSSLWEFKWMDVVGAGAEAYMRSCGFSEEKPCIEMATDPGSLERLMLDIWRALGNRTSVSRVLAPFYALPDLCGGVLTPKTTTGLVEQALEIMEGMMHTGINIKELASQLGIGRVSLFTAFKDRYGCGPSEYFESLKMARAKELLLNSSRSIESVALSVGYRDVNYFSRRFRGITGVGPRSFRRGGCGASKAASTGRF